MVQLSKLLIIFPLFCSQFIAAFFFNQQQQQQHQQQQQQQHEDIDYQKTFLDNTHCQDYLCPTTLKCVKTHIDCPCPYPNTQMKCLIKEKGEIIDTICIAKPFIVDNPSLQAKYDDQKEGYKLKTKGVRDCGWAEDAYYGRV